MIDVIIVNWNAGERLRACVRSVINNSNEHLLKIIVVDNGSSDGSLNTIREFSNVLVIKAGANLGFGRACNLGAIQSDAEFILFLNPDAEIYGGNLIKVREYMELAVNADVGICGIGLEDEQGRLARSCARFPTPSRFFANAIGLTKLWPTLGCTMSEWDHRETRAVDQVIGAFFLIRRKVFESLNGFDERFFVYFEEVDLSFRARLAGWRSVFLADATAFHLGGGTSNQVKAKRLFYSLQSRLLYASKNFSRLEAAGVFFTTVFLEFISRLVLALLKRSWVAFKETCVGYGMLFRWLTKKTFFATRG
jgi:hypothetical protein